MARFFIDAGVTPVDGTILLNGEDARHISLSLRMAVGDALTVCDGAGTDYSCTIFEITKDTVVLKIKSKSANFTEPPVTIHLYQSLAKGDKMDFIVQKAVELGVSAVTPVSSEHCILHLDTARAADRQKRWQKIAGEAAKQCGRGLIPDVCPMLSFADAVKQAVTYDYGLFCYEGDDTTSLKLLMEPIERAISCGKKPRVAFFIGPEGGYSPKEARLAVDSGLQSANLGRRILRCETASGFVLSSMIYAFEL